MISVKVDSNMGIMEVEFEGEVNKIAAEIAVSIDEICNWIIKEADHIKPEDKETYADLLKDVFLRTIASQSTKYNDWLRHNGFATERSFVN